MTVKQLNHYKGTYDSGTSIFADAETMTLASELFSQEGTEPVLLQKVGTGVKVIIPDPALAFKTTLDDTAKTAGCRAYPSGGNVTKGQKLFLTAVTGDGYKFVGWYQGTVLLSADAEAEVTVDTTASSPVTIEYEAKFELE